MFRKGYRWVSRRYGVPALCLLAFAIACRGSEPVQSPAEPSPSMVEEGSVVGDGGEVLVLAIVAEFPASALAEIEAFSSWLNSHWGQGGQRIVVRAARSVPEVAQWLRDGDADFFMDSPLPVLLARHLSGCRPVLRRWKYGEPAYKSVFFVRADSDIQSLEDLVGRVLAFEDRYSSSSFFLPMEHLLNSGLQGAFLPRVDEPVLGSHVGLVFSGGDSTTMHWVLAGKVAAGAMNEYGFHRYSGDELSKLRVVAWTDEIPRGLVAVRHDLAPDIENRLVELLLAADDDPAGREMLQTFSATDRFDEIPDAFIERMGQMQETIVLIDEMAGGLGHDVPASTP